MRYNCASKDMIENSKKIDAHGHFGPSFLGPQSTMGEYLRQARNINVVATIASPGPTPELQQGSKLYRPCMWQITNGERVYFEQTVSKVTGEEVSRISVRENPYHDVNTSLIAKVRMVNKKNIGPQVFVMPIYHPILDTKEEVEKLMNSQSTIALKLHGISTFTGPSDVPSEVIDVLKKSNKPIIVHTDTYTGEVTSPIHTAYKMNESLLWVEWARETGVRTLITHGACLSSKAIELARYTDNVMIGIAPDLLIQNEPERLAIDGSKYLSSLIIGATPGKLLFDIDYGWNVIERDRWDQMDWNMHLRIVEAARRERISDKQIEDIFINNAIRFYNL